MHSHWCGIQTGSLWCQSQSMNWKLYYAFHMWATNLGGRFVLFLSCFAAYKDRLYSHKHQRTEFPFQTRSILQLHPINLRNSCRSSAHNQAKQLLPNPKQLILMWVALNFTQKENRTPISRASEL